MASLLYSPGIQVRIFTARNGIIDVSDDIEDGSVTLVENGIHTASLTLANPGRKYDGVFTPNDRISIAMKRIKWLQIMTGYLNRVPFYSAYSRPVQLTASCSLKALQYTMWDKGASYSVEFLNSFSGGLGDDSFVQRAVGLLTDPKLGRWDPSRVHVGRLPDNWAQDIDALIKDLPFEVPAEVLGTLPIMGSTTGSLPGYTRKPADREGVNLEPPGPGYGDLPSRSGKISVQPLADWRIQMRWPYYQPTDIAPYFKTWLTPAQETAAKAWWRETRLLVVNPSINAAICVEASDWGPPDTSTRSIALNEAATTALGVGPEDTVYVRFAPLGTPLGPYALAATPTAKDPSPGLGAPPEVVTTTTVNSTSSTTWTSADKLRPNCNAARTFIRNTWGKPWGISGWRDASTSVDDTGHPMGLALDVMTSNGGEPDAEGIAFGNAVAMWFLQNPEVFGLKYVIWYERINSGKGWKTYNKGSAERDPSKAHRNHVHLSFENTGRTSPGPAGNPWPGSSPSDFTGGFSPGSVVNGIGPSAGPVSSSYDWTFARDPESDILVGPRALMNDQPLLPDIGEMLNTAMRSYCSAPNGDFISWFPDYFGHYGLAGKVLVRSIELKDFTIDWDDERLKTHQFTSGSWGVGYGSPYSEAYTSARRAFTFGIVTVEMPNVMKKLLNVPDGDTRGWGDGAAILQRFGARPEYTRMSAMADGRAEFWYALYRFQKNWASQFHTTAPITFMPELFPGMLMALPDYGVQFYVESVTHRFSFRDGGGFTTDVNIMAPSAVDGSGFFGLPVAAPIIDPSIRVGELE